MRSFSTPPCGVVIVGGGLRAAQRIPAPAPSSMHVPARSSGIRRAAPPDARDVRDLIQRDRGMVGLSEDDLVAADAFLEETEKAERGEKKEQPAAAAAATAEAVAAPAATPAPASTPATSKAKAAAARARGRKGKEEEEVVEASADDGITTCRLALDAGEAALRSGNPTAALALFERALDLPGSAAVRLAGRPLEFGVPSDGEAAAALFNMACAYAALGQTAAGLTCLDAAAEAPGSLAEGLVEALRSDPDLDSLRGDPGFAGVAAKAARALASGGGQGDDDEGGGGGGLLGVFGKKGKPKKEGMLGRMLRPW